MVHQLAVVDVKLVEACPQVGARVGTVIDVDHLAGQGRSNAGRVVEKEVVVVMRHLHQVVKVTCFGRLFPLFISTGIRRLPGNGP